MSNKRKNQPTISPKDIYGKIPPQDINIEKAILGTVISFPEKNINSLFEIIMSSDVFYLDAHKRIFESIQRLYIIGSTIDNLTIVSDLRKHEVLDEIGGAYYITSLSEYTATNIESHARILLEHYFNRELIRVGTEIVSEAYRESSDVFDTFKKLREIHGQISSKIETTSYRSFNSVLHSFMNGLNKEIEDEKLGINKVNMMLNDYDAVLRGLRGGNIYVIAARTSMGKTSFEVSVALEQSTVYDIGIWNGELTERRFLFKMISNKLGIEALELQENLEKYSDKIIEAVEDVLQHKLHIDNTPNIDIDVLCNKIKYWVFKKGVKLIWLDYLQVIRINHSLMQIHRTRAEQIAYIIDQLNEVSKACDVPIVILAQVNREALKMGDKRPTLSHLRDSGSIEERVYHVSFLHRPEYYGEQEFEGRSTEGLLQLLVRKNGDGQNNVDIDLRHELKYNRVFSNSQFIEPFNDVQDDTPF